MNTYKGEGIQNCSDEVLCTRIAHLAHDLDKTINTESVSAQFDTIINRDIKNLSEVLGEWSNRFLPLDNLIIWTNELLVEAKKLIAESPVPTAQAQIPKNTVDYVKAEKFLEMIKTRRSIRSWLKQKVPRKSLEMLVEAATWAPSACNRQSVRYILLENEEQKMALVKLREKFISQAPALIFLGADRRNYYPEEAEIVPYLDTAMAAQNLLLLAHTLGLGAVIVKCTNVDIHMDSAWSGGREREKAIIDMYSLLNLPDYFIPVAIVAIGFPARTPKQAPPRLPIDTVRFFNQFQNTKQIQRQKDKQYIKTSKWKWLVIKIIRKTAWLLGFRLYITKK